MPLDTAAKPAASFKSSACPHDCPATCALEVEVLPDNRVGRFRGASDNAYTAGVLCAKVGRYADRVHHPDRLMQPLRRSGPKGSGQFTPISWDEALDEIAARFKTIAETHGAEAIWPYYYAGTMGQVQRDGIHRLRHALGYSDQKRTICTALAPEFAALIMDPPEGTIIGPLMDPRGLTIVKVLQKFYGPIPPLSQVHDQIEQRVARQKSAERYDRWIKTLRAKAMINRKQ